MRLRSLTLPLVVLLAGGVVGCKKEVAAPARVVKVSAGPNVQEDTKTALIKARPGDVIEFGEGTFEFTGGLALAVENVTLRGQGVAKTTLSFAGQDANGEGLLVTRGGFVLEDLSVDNAKGDAVKVNDVDGVTFRRVRAQWTGGEKPTNGKYGLYPVQCTNVLIEECEVYGASDAGIYVGQSTNIIVRNCRAERNVAGIEIENSTDADVHDNVTTNNAGGLLVFDLPGLPVKNGKRVRVFNNRVVANNHANFATEGTAVASVAPGTGVMVMAADQVEVFKNTLGDNQTCNLAIVSYYMLESDGGKKDPEYDPFPEGVHVHDNTFSGGGNNPGGPKGAALRLLFGDRVPDILYDGVVNPARLVGGELPAPLRVCVRNNGAASFANLQWSKLPDLSGLKSEQEVAAALMAHLPRVERDPKSCACELEPLPPVTLRGSSK
jgi:parallel beta-helix repeat protein